MQQRGLPESDRDVAVAHANLGVAYAHLSEWEQAEALMSHAISLNQQHRPGSLDYADSLDQLGWLLLEGFYAGYWERLDQAVKLRQFALVIRRRISGRHSDLVAEALNGLGAARRLQGRKRAALRLQISAWSIWRDILQPNDARLSRIQQNVGAGHLETGDPAQAEPLLRKALTIREAVFAAQPQHPHRRRTAGWLISCLLVLARAGVNRGPNEMRAKRLCAQYGFDFDQMVAKSRDYPDTPTP